MKGGSGQRWRSSRVGRALLPSVSLHSAAAERNIFPTRRFLTTTAAAAGGQQPNFFARAVPNGDSKERLVCQKCGFINYQNPKIVAGVVALSSEYEADLPIAMEVVVVPLLMTIIAIISLLLRGKILLCRRGIPPRRNFWNLPAGL